MPIKVNVFFAVVFNGE